jgi:hypothetical protein
VYLVVMGKESVVGVHVVVVDAVNQVEVEAAVVRMVVEKQIVLVDVVRWRK